MTGIPTDLATRLVKQESSFNPHAKSPVGAMGLTQLMPDTAKMLGVSDPFNAAENLAGGFKYLSGLYKQFGSWGHALAAYNWGPGNVQAWLARGGNMADLPAETRQYVATIAPHEFGAIASRKPKKSHLQLLGDRVPALPHGAVPVKPKLALPQGAVPVNDAQQPVQDEGVHLAPSLAMQGAQALEKRGLGGYAHAIRGLADATNNPMSILNAVLGAPQRFVAGGMQQDEKHDKPQFGGSLGTYHNLADQELQELGGGLYGVFHPNDQSVQTDAEQSLGASRLKTTNQSVTGKAQNFDVDMGFQTLTDPLTYTMGPMRKLGELGIAGLSRVGDRALGSSNKLVRNTAATVIPHPEIREAFTPKGRAAVVGIKNSEATRTQRQAHIDAQLLKKYKKQIGAGEVPQELRQRLLREPFLFGTQKMRTQALLYGYAPTQAEMATKPLGVLDYDLKDDYFPHLGQTTMPDQLRILGKKYQISEPRAGFEKHQETEQLPPDRIGAMEYRLAAGRAAIRHRLTQQRIAQETGLPLEDANVKSDGGKIDSHVLDTAKAFKVLETPSQPEMEGIRVLQKFSNIGRDTLIGANPVPHSKNISTLAYLAGGIPGFTKGLRYALSGVPKKLAGRLDEGGAGTHFMLTEPEKLSSVRLIPPLIRHGSQAALDRLDMGMRAARLEQIDKEFPNLSEFEKSERVNQDIGAYRDSPAYVSMAQRLGAQFPQWHGYIVPTTVSRAILKNPQRVESMIRATDAMNQDFVGQNQPYTIEPGGPVEEFGSLTQTPGEMLTGKAPTYLTSPSMIGPIGSGISRAQSQPQSFQPPGGDMMQYLIPYFNVIAPQMGINPYGSKAPKDVRSIAAFFAAYPKAKESYREKRTRDLMEQGLTRFQAERQVMRDFSRLRRFLR